MTTSRRTVLAGLAGLGATTALPAWAQAIRPQSDPYAQVDPYADERNGFPSERAPYGAATPAPAVAPTRSGDGGEGGGAPMPPSEEELAARNLGQILSDPEQFEIVTAKDAYYFFLVVRPDKGQGPVHKNRAAQAAMHQFCVPFFRASDRPHLPWQVVITDTPELNGFAVGGGKIAITAGLIAHADHPAELAAVVAHEIGHCDYRHTAKSLEVEALMKLSKEKMSVATGGGLPKELVDGLQAQFGGLVLRGYTRENEFEADYHVVTMLNRVGMDPGRQLVMWDKMVKVTGDSWNRKSCIMDTHPVMRERAQALISVMGGTGNPRAQYVPPGWAELKRIFPTPQEYRWG